MHLTRSRVGCQVSEVAKSGSVNLQFVLETIAVFRHALITIGILSEYTRHNHSPTGID
jgi:hypothetical protein